MKISKNIKIKLQFEAVHCWPTCNIKEVEYLRNLHRHIFYIEIQKRVKHNNRDIEIIMFKQKVLLYLGTLNGNLKDWSCEDLAEHLLNKYDAVSVEVLEDNENGAIVFYE